MSENLQNSGAGGLILGIESSCDDSSVALLDIETLELKFHKKISQDAEHCAFGGVVPELAARLHTAALPKILEQIKPELPRVKAVAVTNEPGLSVSLVGGVAMAKALASSLRVPLIAVNHLAGHVYSLFLSQEARLPAGALLVSGGHTMVLDIGADGAVSVLAATMDDSFGESFDKVAKMLGRGYPGGTIVQNLALKSAARERFNFTVPLLHDKRLEYSFSGLKNQARVAIERLGGAEAMSEADAADLCAGFEDAACAHVADKLTKILARRRWRRLGVVGGASANLNLRARLRDLCESASCELLVAPLEFCSDNAAMIARAGREKFLRGEFSDTIGLKINPRADFSGGLKI